MTTKQMENLTKLAASKTITKRARRCLALAVCCLACLVAGAQPFASGYVEHKESPMYSFVGKKFADIAMKGLDKKTHRLSEYVGKGNQRSAAEGEANYVLIDFWASWCQPCMREMPTLKECYAKYHKKGFDIVACSLDNNGDDWLGAIKNAGLTWHHLSDLKGFDSLAASTYKLEYIPWSLLCDPKGIVVHAGLQGDELRETLRAIYGF